MIEFNDKYFNFNDEYCVASNNILLVVRKEIDEKRFLHSKSVGELCYKIALSNKLDNPIKYYFAGLVHDLAKNKDKNKEVVDKYLNKIEKSFPSYTYHQFLAPFIVKELFNYEDEEIFDAIKYHCTGKKNMSKMGKIVYASDKIDPLRGYDSNFMIEAMIQNYESGFILVLKENLKFLKEKNKDREHPNPFDNQLTKDCAYYYLDEDFIKSLF